MAFLSLNELRKKSDKELENIYQENFGLRIGTEGEAEQSSNRSKIEFVLRERADKHAINLAWIGIWVAIILSVLSLIVQCLASYSFSFDKQYRLTKKCESLYMRHEIIKKAYYTRTGFVDACISRGGYIDIWGLEEEYGKND